MKEQDIEDDGFVTIGFDEREYDAAKENDKLPCPVCHGTGEVACAGTRDGMDYDTTEECPNCSEPLKINGVWRRQF